MTGFSQGNSYSQRTDVNVQKSSILERIASGFMVILTLPKVAYEFGKALIKEDYEMARKQEQDNQKLKRSHKRHNLW